jgi:hypothetical protein
MADEKSKQYHRERAKRYTNIRVPRELIAEVDAAHQARKDAGEPVDRAREPFLWWLIRRGLAQEPKQ